LTIDTHHHILPDFFWREYLRRDLAVNAKQRILESSELNGLERRAILGGTAARLFPRLHSVVGDRKSKETSS
jgi:hypothetical protein